jgi:hypothetical protein
MTGHNDDEERQSIGKRLQIIGCSQCRRKLNPRKKLNIFVFLIDTFDDAAFVSPDSGMTMLKA